MIRLHNVSKSYDGSRTFVVKDIDLHVKAGELLVLLGSSGCGKTTTLKMMNRLVDPTSGAIEIEGRDVREVDPVTLRRSIGYVFQGIGLFPHLSVADNVALVPGLLNWQPAVTAARVEELLDLVGLEAQRYGQRFPSELSGGQKQRVGFARALAARPQVMLLDEPFGALDPVTRDSLQLELKSLHRQLGLTAVLVTHDVTEALLLADRIALLHEGAVRCVGTPRELLRTGDEFVARFLEPPRRNAEVLRSLADEGADRPENSDRPTGGEGRAP